MNYYLITPKCGPNQNKKIVARLDSDRGNEWYRDTFGWTWTRHELKEPPQLCIYLEDSSSEL